jgi:hypothetical protein
LDAVICLRWVAYGLLIASIVPAGLSVPQFAKSRSAPYYILRRNALRRAMRLLLAMLIMQALAIALLIVCPLLRSGGPRPTPTPTARLTSTPGIPTQTAIPTITPRPTRAPTATPSPQPTATATTAPPVSPVPTTTQPGDGTTPPAASPVPAGLDARIEFIALAIEKDEHNMPVNPENEFPPGDHYVYLFFSYQGMQNGVITTFAMYRDGGIYQVGEEAYSDTSPWRWGPRGRTFYQWPGDWEPGNYEIHVFIEEDPQFIAEFVITEE